MRRLLALAALLASGFATPAFAQDDAAASCVANQLATRVGPILQQASQFSPQGMGSAGFGPLAQPFAPPGYLSPGVPPAPPSLAPPTAQYNLSAGYTGYAGLPQPGQWNSQLVTNYLIRSGRVNPAVPNPNNSELLIALANLQQTEQARNQQQALLQQQQGLYMNSLYQLSSSYQVTSLDWMEAYSGLAQAWMSYIQNMCRAGGDPGVSAAPAIAPTQNQPMPTYPAGNAPMVPGGAPGYPGLPPAMGR
jgi:hypothetical protein